MTQHLAPASVGLDIGSSSIKAVLWDSRMENAVLTLHRPLDARVPTANPLHYEEDPIAIRDTAFNLLRSIATDASAKGYSIRSIGLTGQMHGGLFVDKNLEPLSNFISWQDKRGDELEDDSSYVQTLRDFSGEDPSGVGIHTGFFASTLYWLSRNRKIPQGAFRVVGIYDWIASLLVGDVITDITSAAAWGMFDILSKRWKHDLIHRIGIPFGYLPDVYEPGARVGRLKPPLAAKLGLDPEVVICAPIGDTQASFIGSSCNRNEILLNIGTGSQSMWMTTDPVATPATDIRYLQKNLYLVTAPTLAGGKAYHILAGFFQQVLKDLGMIEVPIEDLFARMNGLAANAAALEAPIFDPIFSGSRFREEAERASISRLTATNFTTGSITRALLSGMVEEIAAPYFTREGQVLHSCIVGAGNGMRRNGALREIAAARFGLPFRLCPNEEEAATGAAILAAEAIY